MKVRRPPAPVDGAARHHAKAVLEQWLEREFGVGPPGTADTEVNIAASYPLLHGLGIVFAQVDYLRNGWGATTVSAWSARSRPGIGISVPVAWVELGKLTSGAHWNIRTVDERLRQGNAPWEGYGKAAMSIAAAMKLLGYT